MKELGLSARRMVCVFLIVFSILQTAHKNILEEQNKVQRELIDHLQHTCDSLVLNIYVKELKIKK